ncbi:unnamed protein product [Arabidopsis lyrata]|nr:unnamed protein product [Arabidopsis lyrata]
MEKNDEAGKFIEEWTWFRWRRCRRWTWCLSFAITLPSTTIITTIKAAFAINTATTRGTIATIN